MQPVPVVAKWESKMRAERHPQHTFTHDGERYAVTFWEGSAVVQRDGRYLCETSHTPARKLIAAALADGMLINVVCVDGLGREVAQ